MDEVDQSVDEDDDDDDEKENEEEKKEEDNIEEEKKPLEPEKSSFVFNQVYFDWLTDHVIAGRNSNCLCNDCFALKCKSFELLRNRLDAQYEQFKAIAALKRAESPIFHMDRARFFANRKLTEKCVSITELEWEKEYLSAKRHFSSEERNAALRPQDARMNICRKLMFYLRKHDFNFFEQGSIDDETNGYVRYIHQKFGGIPYHRFWG